MSPVLGPAPRCSDNGWGRERQMHFAPKPCAWPLPSPASRRPGLLHPVLGHGGPSPATGLHAATSHISPMGTGDAIPRGPKLVLRHVLLCPKKAL